VNKVDASTGAVFTKCLAQLVIYVEE
jgi:hypothetical protein